MENLIWLVVIGVIILIAFKAFDSLNTGAKITKEEKEVEFFYKLKPYLFTRSEQAFFIELHKQVSSRYGIFPKVRIPDFIDVDLDKYKEKSRWQSHWNRIKAKHVDFLLCDPTTAKPLIAIELNGKSHQSERMIARDEFVGKMYDKVGIKFITFKVGDNYEEKIRSLITNS